MEEIERQYLGLEEEQRRLQMTCDQTMSKGLKQHQQQSTGHNTRTMGVRSRSVASWPSVLLLLLIQITQNVIYLFSVSLT